MKKIYLIKKHLGDVEICLPNGYTQLEYIEFHGQEWIDTGIKLTTANTDIVVENTFMQEANALNSTNDCVMGARSGSGAAQGYKFTNCYGGYFENQGYGVPSIGTTRPGKKITLRYELSPNRQTLYDNGNIVYDNITAQTPAATTYNLTIGAMNSNTKTWNFHGNIYECYMSIADVDIFHMIPAKRNSDNKYGFYDLVRETFYMDGSGKNTLSGPVLKERKTYVLKRSVSDYLIPDLYQEVEYIQNESSGAAWIDTGLSLGIDYQIDCDMQVVGAAKSNYWWGQNQVNSMEYNAMYNVSNLEYNWKTISGIKTETGNRLKMTQTLNNDGTVTITTSGGTNTTVPAAVNKNDGRLLIFACNPNPVDQPTSARVYGSQMRLYRFTVHMGDWIISDLIPVKRKSDNAVGVYDLIRKIFITKKTGTLTAGPNVTRTPVIKKYLVCKEVND